MRITRSPEAAEEIVQDTFVKLWSRARSYDAGRGSLRAFVLTIVRNRAVDVVRSESTWLRKSTTDEGLAETQEGPWRTDLEVARREEAASVRAALGRLPEGQSRAIELAFFAGLTHREIAAQLRLPVGTVKGRIRLGIEKLGDELRGLTDTSPASGQAWPLAGARGQLSASGVDVAAAR
jgi:RNA polymerase sigma-70 factor (ECF subfamily)